jgi:hypothetical protein
MVFMRGWILKIECFYTNQKLLIFPSMDEIRTLLDTIKNHAGWFLTPIPQPVGVGNRTQLEI